MIVVLDLDDFMNDIKTFHNFHWLLKRMPLKELLTEVFFIINQADLIEELLISTNNYFEFQEDSKEFMFMELFYEYLIKRLYMYMYKRIPKNMDICDIEFNSWIDSSTIVIKLIDERCG